MATAKEIAEKHAGKLVNVVLTNSNPIKNDNGDMVKTFLGRIIGWHRGSSAKVADAVIVEVMGGSTNFKVGQMGFHTTFPGKNKDAYGKRVFPDEVIIPAGETTDAGNKAPRIIPDWPHKCPACQSPAYFGAVSIDCSNAKCHYKYRTHSGIDLFIPENLRESTEKPVSNKKYAAKMTKNMGKLRKALPIKKKPAKPTSPQKTP